MDVPAMYPGDDYAGGVVVELMPDRRCRVRLNNGREVVACIPYFIAVTMNRTTLLTGTR